MGAPGVDADAGANGRQAYGAVRQGRDALLDEVHIRDLPLNIFFLSGWKYRKGDFAIPESFPVGGVGPDGVHPLHGQIVPVIPFVHQLLKEPEALQHVFADFDAAVVEPRDDLVRILGLVNGVEPPGHGKYRHGVPPVDADGRNSVFLEDLAAV